MNGKSRPAATFPAWMEERLEKADRVLCVVSATYLTKDYSSWERRAAQWAAASKRPNFVLPVFVEDCEAPVALAHIKRCDLVRPERGRCPSAPRSISGAGRKAVGAGAFPGGRQVREA